MKWTKTFSKLESILFVLFAGLAVASLAYFFNEEVLGSGKGLMNKTLFTDQKSVTFHTVLMRIIGPIISFNTGASGVWNFVFRNTNVLPGSFDEIKIEIIKKVALQICKATFFKVIIS